MASAKVMAIAASCSVTGSFSAIRSSTGRLVRSEMPRLPCSAWKAQAKYCSGSGIVEAVLLAQRLDDDGVALLARQHEDGIARQQLLQHEHEDRDEHDRRDRDEDAPGDEVQHWVGPVRPEHVPRSISGAAWAAGDAARERPGTPQPFTLSRRIMPSGWATKPSIFFFIPQIQLSW